MKSVTAAYAKAHLPELLKEVSRGGTVAISRYNKPVAELVPSSHLVRPVPKFGTGKGKVTVIDLNWADPMTEEEAAAFYQGSD